MTSRILCVDDEPNVLQGFERQLHKRFEVYTAAGGEAGLEVIRKKGPFAVVVSDLRMPGMDGVRFLATVRENSPDTIRMMLTGQGDMNAAIAAVNEGNIFRFLTKPISPLTLVRSLEAALEQHRLVTAERELLENTLGGAIKVLTEVLSLVNPIAFSRGARVRRYATHIAKRCQLAGLWEIELAAMLSQIGCITVPSGILDKVAAQEDLTDTEQEVYSSHPRVARKLLENIPRLEPVARMIEGQLDHGAADLSATNETDARIAMGAEILRAAMEFDHYAASGASREAALLRMQHAEPYSQNVLAALESVEVQKIEQLVRTVSIRELDTRMTIEEDVWASNGMLLLTKGQEVTYTVIERLKSFARTVGVVEPIKVLAPAAPAGDEFSLPL